MLKKDHEKQVKIIRDYYRARIDGLERFHAAEIAELDKQYTELCEKYEALLNAKEREAGK